MFTLLLLSKRSRKQIDPIAIQSNGGWVVLFFGIDDRRPTDKYKFDGGMKFGNIIEGLSGK